MKATYKGIKLNFNGELKRLSLPRTFQELQALIPNVFGITPAEVKAFTIHYLDDEQDRVLISNEYDYQQATIFMDKADMNVLKIFLTDADKQVEKSKSLKFEMINDEENAVSIQCVEKKTGNKIENHDDIIVQSMNEMGFSTDFAKSVVFSQDKEFVVDSHGEECNELVKNLEEKLTLNTGEKSSEKVSETIYNLEGKIEDQKLLGKKTNKEFNLYEFLIDKIKEVPPFQAMIEYIMQQRGENGINNSNKLTVEKVKKNVRTEIAKAVRKQLKRTEKKILSSLYTEADKEVEKLFNSNLLENKEEAKRKSTAIHKHVRCDGCRKKPIEGTRFKCSICENFDYCEECEEKNKDSHSHPFIKIRRPELEPTKIVTVVDKNPPKSGDKLNKVKDKVKNYAEKYMKFTENVSNDLTGLIEKIKLQCPKLLNDLKPCKNFYEVFDCRNTQEKRSKENKISSQQEMKKVSAKCLTSNLIVPTVNNSTEIRKSIKLVNDGAHPWPKYCYFTCLEDESAVRGRNVPIKIKVEPGQEINIELALNLKQITEEGIYPSVWQLQNEKRENFGEKILLKIDAKFPKDLMVDIEFQQVSKEVFPKERKIKTTADLLKQIKPVINQNLNTKIKSNKEEINYTDLMNQLKSDYNLKGIGENNILYALVRAKGNKEMAVENLLTTTNFCDYHQKHFN